MKLGHKALLGIVGGFCSVVCAYLVIDYNFSKTQVVDVYSFEEITDYSKEEFYQDYIDITYNEVNEQDEDNSGSSALEFTGEWYISASGMQSGGQGVKITDEYSIYSKLPWVPDEKTYIVDMDQATRDLYTWVKEVSGTEISKDINSTLSANGRVIVGSSYSSSRPFNGFNAYADKTGWIDTGRGVYKEIEGITCVGIGFPPIVMSKTYNNKFSESTTMWQTKSSLGAEAYRYSTLKVAVILEKNDSKEIFYMPCTTTDAKAHTFPGGIVQTNVQAAGSYEGGVFSVNVAATSGDVGGAATRWPKEKIGEYINTVKSSGAYIYEYMYCIVEGTSWDSAVYNEIKGNYRAIGFVVWE